MCIVVHGNVRVAQLRAQQAHPRLQANAGLGATAGAARLEQHREPRIAELADRGERGR
jgi:hypothetical protein